ncbi:hypothetical protein [Bifidobacterium callitrichidarum]|uniref:Uncharacterized protein n=1 Tax=Bifidobacterium callitrichidarum TaxID=2052941 RepID=A0A2U2N739_9BIFI|nr:hypothetical protein [Bifidobacterium callitrichidarum]PWG64774.1 hypothetical protein DF196_08270 [Bifidobacterium callitrichidarum]
MKRSIPNDAHKVTHASPGTGTPMVLPDATAPLTSNEAAQILSDIERDRSSLASRLSPPRWLYPTIALLVAFDVLGFQISSAFDSWTSNRLAALRDTYDAAISQASYRNIPAGEIDDHFQPLIDEMLRYGLYSQWCAWLCLAIDLICLVVAYQMMRWLANMQGANDRRSIGIPLLWPWFLTFGVRPMNVRMHVLHAAMYVMLIAYVGSLVYLNWSGDDPFRTAWWTMVATLLWSVFFVASETRYDRLASQALAKI